MTWQLLPFLKAEDILFAFLFTPVVPLPEFFSSSRSIQALICTEEIHCTEGIRDTLPSKVHLGKIRALEMK